MELSKLERDERRQVLYPPVVIAHITKDIMDLFAPKVKGKSEVQIHYSAQMNSYPHLGTVLSLMTAFAIGKRLQMTFNIPVRLKFEVLENAPGETKLVNGLTYTKMLSDTIVENESLSDKHLKSFIDILNKLKSLSGIDYELLTYHKFQEIPFVRKTLITILNRENESIPIVAPSEDHLRIRFPCPICKFAEKSGVHTVVKEKGDDRMVLESECSEHGKYQISLTPDSKDFVDINTPLRNIIKEALFIEEAKSKNALDLMVDGGDLVAMTDFIVEEGLVLLGYSYRDQPTRLFTPIIEDWSGAKFSKSAYVQQGTYNYLPTGFLNFEKFKEEFGERGILKLWEQSESWVSDPKKLFRNYTAQYLLQVLRDYVNK